MSNHPKLQGHRFLLSALLLAACGFSPYSPKAAAQHAGEPASSSANPTQYQLKVSSNLVVVRVVVRDPQGKPVEGLKKEDFRLFDRGKEQNIAQFEEEQALALKSSAPLVVAPGRAPAPALPKRFLALYFDDLSMSDTDIIDARDAADRYLAGNLDPNERVALFTSSATLSDFTSDIKQIHQALTRLHAHPHGASHADCPEISDYQAFEISQNDNPNSSDAWRAVLDEAMMRCHMSAVGDFPAGARPPQSNDVQVIGLSKQPTDTTLSEIQALARSVLAQAEIRAQNSFQALGQVANYLAQMPGQRNVIMISPGFFSRTAQYELDRIIDRALRAQVVISSLDPRGLALLMRQADVTSNYTPSSNSGVIASLNSSESSRELAASDVLQEVASGTGGDFFHNNNDLAAGFRALAGLQGSYILAFAPSDVKPDGRFHALKVTLAEKHSGFHVQARRGYFAPRNEAEAQAQATDSDPEMQQAEQIREAVLSKTEVQELPVVLGARLSDLGGDMRRLVLLAHLDAKAFHFHKEGGHNLNTVVFVFAIFNEKNALVTTQERRAHINLPDARLPDLEKAGVDVDMTFELKPGIYRVREVVAESEDHHMTTLSRKIQVQ